MSKCGKGDFEMKTEQEQIEEVIRLQSIMKGEPIVAWDFSNTASTTAVCLFEQTDKGIILSQRSFRNTGIVTIQGYRKASDVIDEFVERLKELLIKHEHRSQTDGIPFYQMDAESFCDELHKIAEEMRQEVKK